MNESDLTTRVQSSASRPRPASALLPGTVLARRYPVAAPLGHGGMGEVYRADDMKLGQGVALKFLPRAVRDDEARRQRLRDEVKIARLVAHPNVCRVWDLVEADGHEFIDIDDRPVVAERRCRSKAEDGVRTHNRTAVPRDELAVVIQEAPTELGARRQHFGRRYGLCPKSREFVEHGVEA
jgi:serine/threonine protein kinase